jgi:hypothetical protein
VFPKLVVVPVGILSIFLGTASREFGHEPPDFSGLMDVGDYCAVTGMLIKNASEMFDSVYTLKLESGRMVTVIVGASVKRPKFEVIPPMRLKVYGTLIDIDTVSAVGTNAIQKLPFKMPVYIAQLSINKGYGWESSGKSYRKPNGFIPFDGQYRCLVERNENAEFFYTPLQKVTKDEYGQQVLTDVNPQTDDSGVRP